MRSLYYSIILLLACSCSVSHPYLSNSRVETRCQALEAAISEAKEAYQRIDAKAANIFLTFEFSNKSGTPLLLVYASGGKPYLLHDYENNKMFFLGYMTSGNDSILLYMDIFDFYPNGVSEDYLNGMDIQKDNYFDRYFYPRHWYECSIDDPFCITYKIKRNGALERVSNKYRYKLSKWYKKTYYRNSFLPPKAPPKITSDSL